MKVSERDKAQFRYLLTKSIDGVITPDEIQQFNSLLAEFPELEQYYIDNVLLIHLLPEAQIAINHSSSLESLISDKELKELALYEANAPIIEIPEESSRQEPPVEITPPQTKKHKMNTLDKLMFTFSAAAMFFLVFLIYMDTKSMPTFGRIMECRDVVWADSYKPLNNGDLITSNERFLKEGFIRIRMNDGTSAIIEAPSEFRLEQNNRLFLMRGKVTASVPTEAIGFTVRTPSASIVDYGTEFGVLVDKHAITEAHVNNGVIEMRLGSQPDDFEKSMRLTANQAGRISGQEIQTIPSANNKFAYHIPSPFEQKTKSLKPSLYLQIPNDLVSCLKLAKEQLNNIEINPTLSIVDGPALGLDRPIKAFRISGSEKAISIPQYSSNLASLQNENGFFTMGFWLKLDSVSEQIISAFLVDGMKIDDYYRIVLVNKEGKLQHCAYNQSHDLVRPVTTPEPLEPDKWYFVVIVRDGELADEKSIYINGKCAASDIKEKKGTGKVGHFETMQFGGDFEGFKGFTGELSEILFIPRALSPEEIENLYLSTQKK